MARGRPKVELVLTDEERETLQPWSRRPKSSRFLALRSRIVLACGRGLTNTQVARELKVTLPTVGKWRQRFVRKHLDGLLDEPRPGAPRKISDADVERVVTKTLESKPPAATHWSTRGMARATGLSQTAISRIWRAFALQPHRTETFNLSADPLFIDKVRDIVGLYMSPPENAIPEEPGVEIHLVMDNYATHKTPSIQRWLAQRPRYHVHFTPTSASWLNQVERFFAEITEKRIRRGAFRSVAALEKAIMDYLTNHNQNPRPFQWTADADLILGRVANICKRINNSGH